MTSAVHHIGHIAANRARFGVAILFLLHGIVTGGWAPHIPLAKEELDVGTGLFGWILLAMAGGGVVAMPIAGALINRFGSAAICRVSGVLFCLAFVLPVYAGTAFTLAVGLVFFGAALGTLDVAMNAHGLAVEQHLRRAVMSSFHGWYSVGAAIGAGLGGMIVATFGTTAHIVTTLTTAFLLLGISIRLLLPPAVDRGLSGSHFAWPTRATLGLGALCFLALFIEGAMLDWSALHLSSNIGAPLELAGFGFAAFSTGMAVTRFAGDGLRMRFGSVWLVFASALALAIGLAFAILLPSPPLAIIAFAVAGLGVGNIVPVLFAGGGLAEPDAPGRGIAAVTTMGYSGFLLGPPGIGMLAQWVGLRSALVLTIVAALVIAAYARAVQSAHRFMAVRNAS
jgi:MFS family permease